MAREVRVIPASVHKFTTVPFGSTVRKKVAGYARVSSYSPLNKILNFDIVATSVFVIKICKHPIFHYEPFYGNRDRVI